MAVLSASPDVLEQVANSKIAHAAQLLADAAALYEESRRHTEMPLGIIAALVSDQGALRRARAQVRRAGRPGAYLRIRSRGRGRAAARLAAIQFAPPRWRRPIQRKEILHVWGSGHAEPTPESDHTTGYDCWDAVSRLVQAAGYPYPTADTA